MRSEIIRFVGHTDLTEAHVAIVRLPRIHVITVSSHRLCILVFASNSVEWCVREFLLATLQLTCALYYALQQG